MEKELLLPEDAIYLLLKETSPTDRPVLEQILLKHLPTDEQSDYNSIIKGEKNPSLMSDVIAKKIFDADEHPERLEYLFRETVGDNKIVIDHSFKNEGYIQSTNSKKTIFDIDAVTKDNRIADMEFQVSAQDTYLRRGELYGSDLLMLQYSIENNQKKSDVNYENVNGVILVFLLKHSTKELKEYNKNSKRYIHRFKEHKAESGLSYTPLIQTIYVQLDECYKQFIRGEDGENNPNLQLLLSMLYDSNNPKVLEKVNCNSMYMSIIIESQKLVQDKEVQAMLLAEKYAVADLNAIKKHERIEGEVEGKAQNALRVYNNCIARGMSKEDAIAISEIDVTRIPL